MGLTIHVDGGSRGNPGAAGAGVVIRGDEGPLFEAGYFLGEQTNNAAEYLALIHALEEVVQFAAQPITICSDSELLVRQVLGEYRVKSPTLAELFGRAQRLLLRLPQWQIQHVPRERNRRADELANLAMDRRETVVLVGRRSGANGESHTTPAAGPATEAASSARAAPTDARRLIDVRRKAGPDSLCPAGSLPETFTFGATVPQVCVYAAHALLTTVIAMQTTTPDDAGAMPTLTVRCTRTGCPAAFLLSLRSPRNGHAED